MCHRWFRTFSQINLVCLSAFEIIWWRNLQVMSNGYTQCGYHCCISLLALDLFHKTKYYTSRTYGDSWESIWNVSTRMTLIRLRFFFFFKKENHCVHMRSPCCALSWGFRKPGGAIHYSPQGLIALFLQKPESWQLL